MIMSASLWEASQLQRVILKRIYKGVALILASVKQQNPETAEKQTEQMAPTSLYFDRIDSWLSAKVIQVTAQPLLV